MSQPINRRIVLLAPSTVTTSGTGPDIVALQGFHSAVISVTTSTVSGTTPTFDVYLQKVIPQAAATDASGGAPSGTSVYDDILHFTQITTNTTRVASLNECYSPVNTANSTLLTTCDWAKTDAGLTAANQRLGPIGGTWRVKYVLGGTSPSAVLSVVAELIPFGG